jgi:ubiquinone/menaquinone biosynthesis C-methylase UbiE
LNPIDLRGTAVQNGTSHFQVGKEDKNRAISYYGKIAKQYDKKVQVGLLKFLREREKRAVLSSAHLSPPAQTLIDVGCGGGFYSIAAKKKNFKVMSVDASPSMIEAIRDQVDEVQVADIETFSIDRQFDRVLCIGVLDFVLNPEKALLNVCRLVAQDGTLVLLVPRAGLFGWIYRLEKKFVGIRVNLFEENWIRRIVESQGLVLNHVSYPIPTNMVLAFHRPKSKAMSQ